MSFGSSAASGAYWISACADRIFANEMSLTGSFGVYMIRFDLSGTLENVGVHVEHNSTGPFTNLHNVLHPITPAMKNVLTAETNQIYAKFKQRVSFGRKISVERVEKLADGRIYSGQQALENGLVDQVGSLQEVLDYVKHKHGVPEAIVRVFPGRESV